MIRTFVLSTLLSTSAGPETAEPSPSLKIAFNALVDEGSNNYEIFVMNLDGSGKTNVSNREGIDWVYHAHGGKLYFASDHDSTPRKYFLYEMDADGKNVRRLTDFVVSDSWVSSRNGGRELIATARKDGEKAFYIIDTEGRVLSRPFSDSIPFNDPCFSPDGNQIAFRYNKSGVDEIWLMNAEGSDLRQLTHYPEDQRLENPHLYHAGPPFWVPGRNLISYISHQNGDYDIFTIRPDGSGLEKLTADGFNEGWHSWSPDGSLIVYDGSGTDEDANFDIYLMNADGTDVRRLTTDPAYEQAPLFVELQGN